MFAIERWQAVVLTVNSDSFVAELTPYVGGKLDYTRHALTTFDYDELGIPGDRGLIDEGTVLYWMLVRRTNEAGTFDRTSVLRVRRSPAPPISEEKRARGEAEDLLGKYRPKESS